MTTTDPTVTTQSLIQRLKQILNTAAIVSKNLKPIIATAKERFGQENTKEKEQQLIKDFQPHERLEVDQTKPNFNAFIESRNPDVEIVANELAENELDNEEADKFVVWGRPRDDYLFKESTDDRTVREESEEEWNTFDSEQYLAPDDYINFETYDLPEKTHHVIDMGVISFTDTTTSPKVHPLYQPFKSKELEDLVLPTAQALVGTSTESSPSIPNSYVTVPTTTRSTQNPPTSTSSQTSPTTTSPTSSSTQTSTSTKAPSLVVQPFRPNIQENTQEFQPPLRPSQQSTEDPFLSLFGPSGPAFHPIKTQEQMTQGFFDWLASKSKLKKEASEKIEPSKRPGKNFILILLHIISHIQVRSKCN